MHNPIISKPLQSQEANKTLPTTFHECFELYSGRTDGKEKIATAVGEFAQREQYKSLLDLGAGDGRLTRLLAPFFEETAAVERHGHFIPLLNTIPNVTSYHCAMQDFIPQRKYDFGLMSYSLSGVAGRDLSPFLDRLFRSVSANGAVCLTTFRDGCAWDLFADHVYSEIGTIRTGGLARHQEQLNELGFQAVELRTIPTLIWAPTLSELYNTLSFFFLKNMEAYYSKRDLLQPVLNSFTVPRPDGGRAIPVLESIVKIDRNVGLGSLNPS